MLVASTVNEKKIKISGMEPEPNGRIIVLYLVIGGSADLDKGWCNGVRAKNYCEVLCDSVQT